MAYLLRGKAYICTTGARSECVVDVPWGFRSHNKGIIGTSGTFPNAETRYGRKPCTNIYEPVYLRHSVVWSKLRSDLISVWEWMTTLSQR